MLKKFVEKYLSKQGLKTVNEKEYENMIRYRATRGLLKKIVDEHNELVDLIATSVTTKILKEALTRKGIEDLPTNRGELQKLFLDTYEKEFKKYD